MRIHELGHVVLYVTSLPKTVHFYEKVLGFKKIGEQPGMAAFSSGRTHHELLLIEIGGTPKSNHAPTPSLYHIGFKIGNTDKELKSALATMQKENVTIIGMSDHTVTHSLYVLDPDGNELELYVDINEDWRKDPGLVMSPTRGLELR